MKKTARKEMSAEKSGRRKTGGGPPPLKPSEATIWLNSVMGESISGLPAVYNSDVLDETRNEHDNMSNVVLEIFEEKNLDHENNTLMENWTKIQDLNTSHTIETDADTDKNCEKFDTSTPKALLRKPIAKQLSNYNKKKTSSTPYETRKRIIRHLDSKGDYMAQKEAHNEQLKQFALEEHFQNLKEKKEMHDTKIAHMEEKHRIYLEQQKELHTLELEFKKKMHALLLEKAELELKQVIHK